MQGFQVFIYEPGYICTVIDHKSKTRPRCCCDPVVAANGRTAKEKLALSRVVDGYFIIPIENINEISSVGTVASWNNELRGGTEVKIPHDVSIENAIWIPISN